MIVAYFSKNKRSIQKIIVAHWLETQAPVLFFDEPSRGIDVKAKAEMFELIESLAAEGCAVIAVRKYLNLIAILRQPAPTSPVNAFVAFVVCSSHILFASAFVALANKTKLWYYLNLITPLSHKYSTKEYTSKRCKHVYA